MHVRSRHDASIAAAGIGALVGSKSGWRRLHAIGRLPVPRSQEIGLYAAPCHPTADNFQIVLPLPPGVNNQYVSVGRRRVLSAPAKSFNRDVAKLIAAQRTSGQLSTATEQALASSLLGVYLVYFFQTPHRRDLDGGLKICLDALARTIGFDDRAVVDLHLSKKIDPLRPELKSTLKRSRNGSSIRPIFTSVARPPDV